MKKVVIKIEASQTLLSKVSSEKYYGIVNKQGDKGLITRQDYESGDYLVYVADHITKGNGFGYRKSNLKELLKVHVDSSMFQVYEFDTHKELFKWLSE